MTEVKLFVNILHLIKVSTESGMFVVNTFMYSNVNVL